MQTSSLPRIPVFLLLLAAPAAAQESDLAQVQHTLERQNQSLLDRIDVLERQIDNLMFFNRLGDIAEFALTGFDLVTAMEVIEHVADKPAFLAALARALKPGGLMILSTPNRTPQSRLLLVEGAERIGAIPSGTHHWDDFVTPDELRALLVEAGLTMGEPRGIGWSPMKGLHLTDDLALNYIVTARTA